MNDEEAAKQKAYYANTASGSLGQEATYEENLDYVVIEALRDSKWRIKNQHAHIQRIQPKADAFDALLAITRAGDRYGNGGLMAAEDDPTWHIDRVLEKIERHMDAVARAQAAPDADGIAEDLPSHFYEGVEAEQDFYGDPPAAEELVRFDVAQPRFDPDYFKNSVRAAKFPGVTASADLAGKTVKPGPVASDFDREQRAMAYVILSGKRLHASDCATSCAPAMEPGPCDCDASPDAPTPTDVLRYPQPSIGGSHPLDGSDGDDNA